MRLYTFSVDGRSRVGVEHGNRLLDLKAAQTALAPGGTRDSSGEWFADMHALIRGGQPAWEAARQILAAIATVPGLEARPGITYATDEVQLEAPLHRPGKILCSGVNYLGHLTENPGAVLPETPGFFAKLPNAVIGPGAPIVHPRMTEQLDYEVELAVVIGQHMRRTPEQDAMSCVMGYTILHDVSARDIQFKAPAHNQITLGKNFDSFCPIGPCIVTADELGDPRTLRLRTYVNGQLLQDGTNEEWVFPLPRLLAFLSDVMTLEPGDVVSTGTPAGVGVFRRPQVFLKPGDHIVLEIDRIGRLENPVVPFDGDSPT